MTSLNARTLMLRYQGEPVTAFDIIQSNAQFGADRNAKDFRTAREQVAAYRRNAVATLIEAGCTHTVASELVRVNYTAEVRYLQNKSKAKALVARIEKHAQSISDYSTANAHFAAAKRARGVS